MNNIKFLALFAVAIVISACGGSDFEWFPPVQDTTAPAVTAKVSGQTLFNNHTTHVTALPASVTFQASEPATIYYTTNGTAPTTSSASVDIPSASIDFAGLSITVTDTILKFFGVDKSENSNTSATKTSIIKSP